MAVVTPVHENEKRADMVVGGMRMPRPFRIRRLGHFGIYVDNTEVAKEFYTGLFGFKVSDPIDMSFMIPKDYPSADRERLGSRQGYFLRHGTDHHSFVVFPRRVFNLGPMKSAGDVTVNQITWQVGNLREVTTAVDWFKRREVAVRRSGRDMPGSNWHVYPFDPEGHINELYYGIEQVGWDGYSKPRAMHKVHYTEAPPLPHKSEYAEVDEGLSASIDPRTGFRHKETTDETFDVGGVLLARPFKIVRIGPVRLFVRSLAKATEFYRDVMGLSITEEVVWNGHRCVFLRANTEHHSIALYPIELRAELGLSSHTTLMSFGLQLDDYQQLKDSITFLQKKGVTIRYLPPELFPGVGHCAFAIDPDGHAMQLYWYMEQIGWDGRPRPQELRPRIDNEKWPDVVDSPTDAHCGENLLGPWG